MSFVSLELNKRYINDRILLVYLLRYTDKCYMTTWFHYWFYIDNIDSFELYVKRNQPYGYGQPRQHAGSQPPVTVFW